MICLIFLNKMGRGSTTRAYRQGISIEMAEEIIKNT